MTDKAEALAEIEERMQKVDSLQWAVGYYTEADDLDPQAQADMRWLIAEVERLRARLDVAERLIEVVRARQIGTAGGVGAAFAAYDALGSD